MTVRAAGMKLTRLDADGAPVGDWMPLGSRPLEVDPVPAVAFPLSVTFQLDTDGVTAEVWSLLTGWDLLETQLWMWGCRRWLHPGELEDA